MTDRVGPLFDFSHHCVQAYFRSVPPKNPLKFSQYHPVPHIP
jgi:hypothetical protein